MPKTRDVIKVARATAKVIRTAYPNATDTELFQILTTFIVQKDMQQELMVNILEEPEPFDPDPST